MRKQAFYEAEDSGRTSKPEVLSIVDPKDFIKDKNDHDKQDKENHDKNDSDKQEKDNGDKYDRDKHEEDRGRAFSDPTTNVALNERVAFLEATVARLSRLIPGAEPHFIPLELRPDVSANATTNTTLGKSSRKR